MEDFPCRTKKINGITYRLYFYRDDALVFRTSFESKEEAQDWINRMTKNGSNGLIGKIEEEPWTATVCIECGKEE
jgi:hypothetical protein